MSLRSFISVFWIPPSAFLLILLLAPRPGNALPPPPPPPSKAATSAATGALPPLKKGEHVKIGTEKPTGLILRPTVLEHDPRTFPKNVGPTEFQLTNEKGNLVLKFVSKDPKLQLDTKGTLVVQFLHDIMYTINPTILTNANWPKGSNKVALGITGPFLKNGVLIRGKAAYSYCMAGGKNCKRAMSQLTYFFHP